LVNNSQAVNVKLNAGVTHEQVNLCLFFDRQQDLWIGGSDGLLFTDLSSPVFSKYGYDPVSRKALIHLYDLLPVDSQVYVNDINGLKLFDCLKKSLTVIDSSGFP